VLLHLVAYNFDGHRYLGGITGSARYLLSPVTRSRALPRAASFAVVHRRFLGRMQKLREAFPNARVRGTLHHQAHGLYAYAASSFSDAAVLVVDSLGETCTTSIAAASRAGDRVRSVPLPLVYIGNQYDRDEAFAGFFAPAAARHSEYERLHLNRWATSEDRLASREDLAACTVLPGPLPPRAGMQYVISADLSNTVDWTVVCVTHGEETLAGRVIVLDQIQRWIPAKWAPVPLMEVRDAIRGLADTYRPASVVMDPHEGRMMADELRRSASRQPRTPSTPPASGGSPSDCTPRRPHGRRCPRLTVPGHQRAGRCRRAQPVTSPGMTDTRAADSEALPAKTILIGFESGDTVALLDGHHPARPGDRFPAGPAYPPGTEAEVVASRIDERYGRPVLVHEVRLHQPGKEPARP
jgi:hypothetical protein